MFCQPALGGAILELEASQSELSDIAEEEEGESPSDSENHKVQKASLSRTHGDTLFACWKRKGDCEMALFLWLGFTVSNSSTIDKIMWHIFHDPNLLSLHALPSAINFSITGFG